VTFSGPSCGQEQSADVKAEVALADTHHVIRGLGIPASGIQAASDRLAATATNIANVSNPAAPRQRVDLAPQAARAGVLSQQRTVDPQSGDLTGDMVDLRITTGLYGVNATVLRAMDETQKSVLDIFA
jgi:flagellar basal body rod protein FlgC